MSFKRTLRGWTIGLTIWLACCPPASAHKQHVHQYIVTEGYALLARRAGSDIPGLKDHIGGLTSSFVGDSAWQKPYVTVGAWREDEEDVVFHHDSYRVAAGLNYALTSITHFWDADQGDIAGNMFRLRIENPPFPAINVDIGPYENAYDKFMRFASGGWVIWYPRGFFATNQGNGHRLWVAPLPVPAGFGVPVAYESLTGFYKSRSCVLRADQQGAYQVLDVTAASVVDPGTITGMVVENDVRDAIVWEVLGRMSHLLCDMSVPAHTHRDEHGLNLDSYEEYAGAANSPATAWNHLNSGNLLDPYTADNEPLHFLMYTMQQIAGHFSSNGPADGDGDDILGGNPRPAEQTFLAIRPVATLGPPTSQSGPWTADNLRNILDNTIPFAIRATAGLLYWFSRETGLMSPLAADGETSATGQITEARLEQNYPNPFNPATTIGYTIGGVVALSGAPLSEVEGPSSTNVRLAVYDLLGREVAVLIDEWKQPGTYSATFDADRVSTTAANGSTSVLPSGVYFCTLRLLIPPGNNAGEVGRSFTETRRMVLVR